MLKLCNSIKTNVWYLRSLEKLVIKMWLSVQFHKKFKGPSLCGGWIKELETFSSTCFVVSFQKNVLSSFLLFSSVCYQDDLSDSKRNETASSTACNVNNSWVLYVKFSETIDLCWNIWLIENRKCQLLLFLKQKAPKRTIFSIFQREVSP